MNTKQTIDGKLIYTLRNLLHPLVRMMTSASVHYKVWHVNKCEPIQRRPIIYAVNHQQKEDAPMMCLIPQKRAYILAGKQRLDLVSKIFFALQGTIFVDRKSKEESSQIKKLLASHLKRGDDIAYFPEGTWNLTPSKLMLPLRWGIIEIARKADAQIIPIILYYDKPNALCSVIYGKPIYEELKGLNNADAIRQLRDKMASLRWYFYEEQNVLSRTDKTILDLKTDTLSVIREYPPPGLGIRTVCDL